MSKKRDEFDVEHNEGRRWNYVRLTLPPYIPETHLEHCDIISIQYLFQFRVEISGGAELKMETPILIGSHLPGHESRKKGSDPAAHGAEPVVNQPWTSRARGFHMGEEDDMTDLNLHPHSHWGLSPGVPELRGEKVVVNNPLFRHGSFATKGAHPGKETKEVPEEQMESTRL